jgi:hypothetical protein
LPRPDRLFRPVHAVHLKHVLCQIDANAHKLHGGLLLSKPVVWKLQFGTCVPSGGGGVHPIASGLSQPFGQALQVIKREKSRSVTIGRYSTKVRIWPAATVQCTAPPEPRQPFSYRLCRVQCFGGVSA